MLQIQEMHLAQQLSTFRRQTGVKQAAMADSLGISQAYYSRIESGTKQPSLQLHAKILRLLEENRFRSCFDQWRLAVRTAPTAASLIRAQGDGIELIEFSQGFRSQGGIYAMLESGERLDGLLGEEVDTHFDRLRQAGAFEGRVLVVENIWQTMMPSGLGYFQAVSTAIPDDLGGTALHSHHLSIEQDDYDAAVRDGRTFRILKR
ncbi:helix-turn-helix transcriptional regulator [Oceanicaulis sp. LC35]|uniref:helix-turn-helix transcriptional regulator n=1 Tax=Oceanicaulis sp. LC35 TaxID=3349635 RepID=UPI003F84EC19